MHRPERISALDRAVFRDLRVLCEHAETDEAVCTLVLTRAGRGFCSSGLDLAIAEELPHMATEELVPLQEQWSAAVAGFRTMSKPVVAAVNGVAAGARLSLALAADIRLALTDARFNAAFVRIGLSGGTSAPPGCCAGSSASGTPTRSCSGRFVDAGEALRLGLVNQVVRANVDAPSLEAAIQLENPNRVLCTGTGEMPEALAAFRERRSARFAPRPMAEPQ